jgi:hypothetical protein
MTKMSIEGAVKGLPKKPEAEQSGPLPKEERDVIRQTFYMPRGVHDQIRELAFKERCSQQELFRRGMNLLFKQEGLASWEELKREK